jgi:hypothetical protein
MIPAAFKTQDLGQAYYQAAIDFISSELEMQMLLGNIKFHKNNAIDAIKHPEVLVQEMSLETSTRASHAVDYFWSQ